MCNHIITVGDGGGGGGGESGMGGKWTKSREDPMTCHFVVNPLLAPWWGYLCQAHLKRGGGLDRDGGLFNFEKAMVSVLLKELGYKVEKLKYKKVGGHAAKDQNQIQTSSL